MKRVYLAGSMEAYAGTDLAKQWRDKAKLELEMCSDNFRVISPTDYYEYGVNVNIHRKESEVMRFDLRKVKESDIILVNLDNIRKSLGTSDEILYSYLNGKPVIGFLETENELSEKEVSDIIHSWKYEQIDRIETGRDAMNKAITYIIGYYSD